MRTADLVLAYKTETMVQCAKCGIWFEPPPRTAKGRSKFCSDSCRITFWQKQKSEQQSAAS